ncbi:ATP-binding protein [Ktedonosporobacter rubrisoli]|nr:ATP-binding protein [Ktedonosporobacter rubrisoli]
MMRANNKVELTLLLDQQPRILFGMTFRQLLILSCGLAIGFSIWQWQPISSSVLLGAVCMVPVIVTTLLFAFLTVRGRSLGEWILIVFVWMLTPEQLKIYKIKEIRDHVVVLDGAREQYQAIMRVEGKNFELLSDADQAAIIEIFQRFLNGLSYPISIYVRIAPLSYHISTLVPSQPTPLLRSVYAHYLSFLSLHISEKQPVEVMYYLNVSATDKEQLNARVNEICRMLSHLSIHRLDTNDLISFYNLLLPNKMEPVAQDGTGRFLDVLKPEPIYVTSKWLEMEGMQHRYIACVTIQLPKNVHNAWLRHVIQAYEPHVDLYIHYQPQESSLMVKFLRRKAIELGGSLRVAEKYGENSNFITRRALKEVEHVRDELLQGSHLYAVTFLVFVRASSCEELKERIKRIRLVLRSLDFRASPLTFQHQQAFLSFCYGYSSMNKGHLLTTEGTASFYPFVEQTLTSKEGVLLGTSSKSIVFIDPFKGRLNANMAILGVPGSGKSFALKVILARLAAVSAVAIDIIDVEGEYRGWTKFVGAAHVQITSNNFGINPLEFQSPQNNLNEKFTTLLHFFEILIGEAGTLSQREKVLLSQSLNETYKEHSMANDPKKPVPSMETFARHLRNRDEELYLRLLPYVHLFPGKTEIPNHVQHVVYDMLDLNEELRPAIIFLVTNRLWNNLREARWKEEARHLVVIDEAWFLTKFKQGSAFLEEFARRIRKYGGGLWISTQQQEDIFSSEAGKNLLSLCNTKLIFKQDISGIRAIRDTLNLSEAQMRYVQTAAIGQAIYLTDKATSTIDIIASEREAMMAASTRRQNSQI